MFIHTFVCTYMVYIHVLLLSLGPRLSMVDIKKNGSRRNFERRASEHDVFSHIRLRQRLALPNRISPYQTCEIELRTFGLATSTSPIIEFVAAWHGATQ
jgi:hypothetical protein